MGWKIRVDRTEDVKAPYRYSPPLIPEYGSKKKLIAGVVLLLIFIAALIYVISAVHNGLPADGQWKGSIHQWKPAFPGQGLVIIFTGIAGAAAFISGVILTIQSVHGDWPVGKRKE